MGFLKKLKALWTPNRTLPKPPPSSVEVEAEVTHRKKLDELRSAIDNRRAITADVDKVGEDLREALQQGRDLHEHEKK